MDRFIIANFTPYIDCHTYEAVCSETYRQRGLQSMPRLRVILDERESALQLCHHREDAPCAVVCSANVITRVDGAVQLNESPCVSCKLRGIACPPGAVEFSDSRPLDIPADASTPRMLPTPPAPTCVSTLLNRVSGTRMIVVKCDLCSFDEQDPACVRTYPAKALHLVDNTDIIRVGKRKHELTFNTDLSNFALSQQARNEEAK